MERHLQSHCAVLVLALSLLATGGVVLGGGIAPAILPFLRGGAFEDSFLGKGRFRELLERIPVSVILDDRAPLLGAAHLAAFADAASLSPGPDVGEEG